MKKLRVALSDAAIADILEQSSWHETQADRNLAKRWEEGVTSTLLDKSANEAVIRLPLPIDRKT